MAEEVFLCGTESLEKEKEEHRRLVLDKAGRFIDGTWTGERRKVSRTWREVPVERREVSRTWPMVTIELPEVLWRRRKVVIGRRDVPIEEWEVLWRRRDVSRGR
jgi:hypothetical protein